MKPITRTLHGITRRRNSLFSLLLITGLFFTACSSEDENVRRETPPPARTLDYTATVSFLKGDGSVASVIDAAVAEDERSRSEGLMDVYDLPEDAGMVFIFDEDAPRSFWMAGTPLSLDILYVNEEMEIVRIHRNTPPYSHESIESELPAKYVIEVNAGYTLRNDITEGSRVRIERQ